jgi:hypothetical protein
LHSEEAQIGRQEERSFGFGPHDTREVPEGQSYEEHQEEQKLGQTHSHWSITTKVELDEEVELQGDDSSAVTVPDATIPEGDSVIVPDALTGPLRSTVPVTDIPEGVSWSIDPRPSISFEIVTVPSADIPEGVSVTVPEAVIVPDDPQFDAGAGTPGFVTFTILHCAWGHDGVPEQRPVQSKIPLGDGTEDGWGDGTGDETGAVGSELGSMFSQGSDIVGVEDGCCDATGDATGDETGDSTGDGAGTVGSALGSMFSQGSDIVGADDGCWDDTGDATGDETGDSTGDGAGAVDSELGSMFSQGSDIVGAVDGCWDDTGDATGDATGDETGDSTGDGAGAVDSELGSKFSLGSDMVGTEDSSGEGCTEEGIGSGVVDVEVGCGTGSTFEDGEGLGMLSLGLGEGSTFKDDGDGSTGGQEAIYCHWHVASSQQYASIMEPSGHTWILTPEQQLGAGWIFVSWNEPRIIKKEKKQKSTE